MHQLDLAEASVKHTLELSSSKGHVLGTSIAVAGRQVEAVVELVSGLCSQAATRWCDFRVLRSADCSKTFHAKKENSICHLW
jgi:hypothetical protein